MKKIPKKCWVWYGFPGHLIVGDRCRYHMSTRIGKRLVSTVGAFYPDHRGPMETVGADPDDYYETMVFECAGEDENGNPRIVDWTELAIRRYADSRDAEVGHRKMCERVARGEV